MNCKACNTRVPAHAKACPQCGRAAPQSGFGSETSRAELLGDSSSRREPLSPSRARAEDDESGEVELGDEVELPLDESMAVRDRRAARGRSVSAPASARERRRADRDAKAAAGSAPVRSSSDRGRGDGGRSAAGPAPAALVGLDAEPLRQLIAEQPDLLEPGLSVLGEEGRRRLGLDAGTEVGEIDLLARSESGDWVVVLVAEDGAGPQVVAEVLGCMGWVRKHVCEEGDGVRAIVLLESVGEELGYAAAAVADSVSFLTWRVSVQFDPIEV